MATNTPNINLYKKDMTTDQTHTFDIDTMLNENWDKIDNAVGDLQTELKTNINQQTTTLTNANPIQHITAKQNCGVDVEIGGEMVVNLLGELGALKNDSDSDGIADGLTATRIINMSSTDGVQSIEASTENGEHITQLTITTPLTIGHDYFYRISAKAPKGKVRLAAYNKKSDGSYESISVYGNYNTTNYEDLGVILTPTSINSVPNSLFRLNIVNEAGSTQYVGNGENIQFKELMYIDLTTMLETITDPTTLLAKYSYTNSAQPLLNPTVEVCGKNLLNADVCSYTIGSKGIRQESTTRISNMDGAFNIKSNTNYTISMNQPLCYIYTFYDEAGNSLNTSSWSTSKVTTTGFTTPENACRMNLSVKVDDSTNINIDDYLIQLEQGITQTPYEPYRGGQIIFPTELAKIDTYQDELTYKDGVTKVDREVKHVVLDGSLDWVFYGDRDGYKSVKINPFVGDGTNDSGSSYSINNHIISRHDSKILKNALGTSSGSDTTVLKNNAGEIYIQISDADSGWGESYTSLTAEDIKAYFNGWVMYEYGTNNIYNGTGIKGWIKRFVGTGTPVTLINGPVTENGTGITKLPTTSYDGYTPYQLYYILQQPIQEEIQPIIMGDGVNLVEGQNTLSVKSGYVWEKANPAYNGSIYYGINDSAFPETKLQHNVGKIIQLVQVNDGKKIIIPISNYIYTTQAYGNERIRILQEEPMFDINAEHFVLYEVLQEDYNCQVQEATITYEDNIREALNESIEEIHNIQSDVSELELANMDTNVKGNGERIERSNGYILVSIENATFANINITFKKAFSEPPDVVASSRMYKYFAIVGGITNTGFVATVSNRENDNITDDVPIHWIAIGK